MKALGASDPTSIGQYRLLGVLGGGGMGRVYLAESRTGRRLAIKIIRADLAEDPVFRRRFEREVAAARAVSPLFTAAVIDADTTATEPWLATTYINGPSLSQFVVAEGPLKPGAVFTLAAGLAEALASIHAAGLVHRDLKPANILLDDAGPHIIDFGIALSPDTTRLTNDQVWGTTSYVAPETLRGEEPGQASDIFALGASLVFAATGKQLVNDGTMHAQLFQISTGHFDLKDVPKELRPLIVRCTNGNPTGRPTADELARILVAASVAQPAPGWYRSDAAAPVVVLPPLESATVSRRRVLIGGAIALGIAGAGAATWVGLSSRGPETVAPPPRTQTPTRPTPTPSGPGRVIWQAHSGKTPVAPSPEGRQSPDRIIVDRGERLIAANGSRVYAVGLGGAEQWAKTLPTGLVNLWPWNDWVVVSDSRTLWILDARTGEQKFAIPAASTEEKDSRNDNPDGLPVEIGGLTFNSTHAFVGLGTATLALDGSGHTAWRRARPDSRKGIRPPSGIPVATRGQWLVTHDPSGSIVDLGLRNVSDGALKWLVQYEPAASLDVGQPPPGGPDGGPDGPPDGGPDGPGGPPHDEAWTRSEGRIGRNHVVIREIQEVRTVALSNGKTAWRHVSQTPIAGIELVGDIVLVAADRLRAFSIAKGGLLWESPLRGARVAAAPDGRSLVVASEQGLSGVDLNGSPLWNQDYPDPVARAQADRITVSGDRAFITFLPLGEQQEAPEVDVIAIALTG